MSEYIIIKEGSQGSYEDKKSVFTARTYRVDSEEEAAGYIDAVKKKYWDARHNCYAFAIGGSNGITRCSDDGEPSGTAGKPILNLISSYNIHNCLIIVTRYFGGVLLGTGGLVRAYTESAKAALKNSVLAKMVPGTAFTITTGYNYLEKIQHMLADTGVRITSSSYTDKVTISVIVQKESCESFIHNISGAANGRAVLKKDCDLPFESDISGLIR